MDKRLQHICENYDKLKIGVDEPFKFNCTMCGKCCVGREDILLNAQDVFRLSKELDIHPKDFIKKYCEVYIGNDSKMVIVRLLPVGPYKICPLLQGHRCIVHNVKPTVCAMFPIGRSIQLSPEEAKEPQITLDRVQYIKIDPKCGDNKKTHTVREWLEQFGMSVDDTFFVEWQQLLMKVSMSMQILEKKLPKEYIHSLYNVLLMGVYVAYDFDKDFMEQFRRNSSSMKQLLDDIVAGKVIPLEGE